MDIGRVGEDSGCAGDIAEDDLRRRHGCTVVGVDRHGAGLVNPDGATVLYPLDQVLLLGAREQLAAARRELEEPTERTPAPALGDLLVHRVRVPDASPQAGRTLEEADVRRVAGVQIAGIQRGGERLLNPSGQERMLVRDELLVLGTPDQLRVFRRWLAGRE